MIYSIIANIFKITRPWLTSYISPLDRSIMLGGINLDTTASLSTYPTKMFTRYVLTWSFPNRLSWLFLSWINVLELWWLVLVKAQILKEYWSQRFIQSTIIPTSAFTRLTIVNPSHSTWHMDKMVSTLTPSQPGRKHPQA